MITKGEIHKWLIKNSFNNTPVVRTNGVIGLEKNLVDIIERFLQDYLGDCENEYKCCNSDEDDGPGEIGWDGGEFYKD